MPRRRRESTASVSPEPHTQRRRTQHAASDDEEAHSETANSNVDDMSKKLVRLALAYEFQRRTIRRADISEKVLGNNSRKFKDVWTQAQGHLRDVFGVEMVELPVKEKITLQQRRDAQKKGTTNAATTSGWIVQSILPSKYKIPEIVKPPAAPTPDAEATYTAIYTLLISLISLSGGSLPDAKMERYIAKLGMSDVSPCGENEKTEFLFKRLQKDGYIVRIKESTGTGEDDVQWLVGPRGKVEVGEDGVRGLTTAVWGDTDLDELDRKIVRSLGVRA